jgi:hypothetical protein
VKPRSNRSGRAFCPITLLALALFFAGCGDNRVVTRPETGSIAGVWEGTLSLTAAGGATVQASRLRLEFVQRDYAFEGLLLKTDPLAAGFGKAPVDTFLVSSGTISTVFISFRAVDPQTGGAAVFEGQLADQRLTGAAIGAGYSGEWSADFRSQ